MNEVGTNRISVTQIISFFYPFSSKPSEERIKKGIEVEKLVLERLPHPEELVYQKKVEREFILDGRKFTIVGKIDYLNPGRKIIYEVKLGIPNVYHLPIKYLKRVQLQLSLYSWLLGGDYFLVLVTAVKSGDDLIVKTQRVKYIDPEPYIKRYIKSSLLLYIVPSSP